MEAKKTILGTIFDLFWNFLTFLENKHVQKIFESTEEIMARYEMANSEANEELIAEIHILKDSMKEINDKENFMNFTQKFIRISSVFLLIMCLLWK